MCESELEALTLNLERVLLVILGSAKDNNALRKESDSLQAKLASAETETAFEGSRATDIETKSTGS
jgi:hypothetical protein